MVDVECLEQHACRVDRFGGGSRIERAFEFVEAVADERDQDAVTVAELVVQRPDGHTGALGEPTHGERLDPTGRDQSHRRRSTPPLECALVDRPSRYPWCPKHRDTHRCAPSRATSGERTVRTPVRSLIAVNT